MKFKLVHVIHLIVFVLFVLSIIVGITKLFDVLELTGTDFSLNSAYFGNSFKQTLFLILPVMGIFIKNKTGWVFITQYFYFIMGNIFIELYGIGVYDIEDSFLFIFFGVLLFSILFIANKQKVSFGYYNIENHQLLEVNLLAFVLAICITMLLYVSKNYHYLN